MRALEFGFIPRPLETWWPETRELLDRAVDKYGTDWADVVSALSERTAQLWLAKAHDGPVAALVSRKQGQTLEIWLAGGTVLSGCVPFLKIVERCAVEDGMTNGRITGRRGWGRVLRRDGWTVSGDDLVKDL